MEITTEELKQKIQNGDKILVDFHGLWCRPCAIMKPTFDKIANQLKEEGSEIQLYTMDVDVNREMVSQLGLRGVPTIKSFKDGKEVTSNTGVLTENQIKQLILDLSNG